MITEDDHLVTLESQINSWIAEIDELRCKVEQMGEDARARYAEQLKPMQRTRIFRKCALPANRRGRT